MRRIGVLFVLRLLLISNAVVITAIGALSLVYVEHPAGIIGAAGCWLFAGLLFGLVPRTDPYRTRSGRREQRTASRRRPGV